MENQVENIPEFNQLIMQKTSDEVLEIANTYDDSVRSIQKKFRVSERENFLIQYKMNLSNTRNFTHYACRMCLSGMTVTTDFSDLRALTSELGRIGNNINQLAHKANMTNNIEKDDFQSLKNEYDQLAKLVSEALLYKLKRARDFQRYV
nr:plasmid mobilization relaxosome protein MobC [Enterococcus sp. 665A]MBO1340294.1 plasmid mobilization relaxosome protein MobC [Enterococcus sp. 665A]